MNNKIAVWIITGMLLIGVVGIVIFQYATPGNETAKSPPDEEEQNGDKEPNVKQQNNAAGDGHFSAQHQDYPGEAAPDFSAEELTKKPTNNWITNGGTIYNDRYSPLDKIDTSNAGDLKLEWVTRMGTGLEFKYSGESTPLVYDGVMFNITGENHVVAMDATTGEMIWEYKPKLPENLDTLCCGWANRGVALGDGKVFVGLLDARLVALDQKTGEVVWETQVDEWEKGYTITSAPLFYDGKIYTGVAGGEYGIRGYMAAYDAAIGREIWKSHTLPAPGEEGSETWPEDNENWLTGGAPIWMTPAVDPEEGLIYFAAGNTSPDLDGSNREGDNLYADSVIALNADTGEHAWHFQEVHHDIWDYDPANPVVLFDVEMDGETRKGIAQAGKTGWVYLLDRTNGEPLVGIEEKPVPQLDKQKTSPTQPFPKGDSFVPQTITKEDIEQDLSDDFDGPYGDIFTPFWEEPLTVKPSPQGGANWPPSAYNPNTELFYVLGNDNYFSYAHYAENEENKFEQGKEWLGSIWQPVENTPSRGTVTAIDVKTNEIVWQNDWDTLAYSGILTTAGNLMFTGHNDGRIIAYDATNGEKVWEFMTDAGANAPPITYKADGKQYISIFSAGNSLAGTQHGDKIYTFSLEGDYESAEDMPEDEINVSPVQDKMKFQQGKDTDSGNNAVDQGLNVYENNCLSCHGEDGSGGHNGPNLQQTDMNQEQLIKQIKNGGGGMPGFEGTLSEEEINSVIDYLKGLKQTND
ncbi:PQQ-binding-like beta-propeller repeat protein [Lentibacillus salicampi]|uniref:C-type cytochrome n=1 Tax=Lentibacillus salicampi TaxID=175306 RepID=A0A4Y9AET6_9BACI|nr:PQQ-binding-like beta-propeller repeat protein [Lentibacillus salicampi]TFJ94389.1 c-type cytochrome [Lentibacillus salicampi]